MRRRLSVLVAALAACTSWTAASAQERGRDWTFNLIEENDSLLHGDKHYTQGLYVSLFAAQHESEDRWFDRLRSVADAIMLPAEGGRLYFGGFLGQSIFTPEDKRLNPPDPADRPYAAWLYGGASLYRETDHTLDRATLAVGLVGPGAGGRKVQNDWHSAFGFNKAEGWSSQLKNEPGIIVSEERKWRLATALGPFETDLLPEINVSLGNIFTYAGAGGVIRFGQRLRADWGQPRVQPALSGSEFVNRAALRDGPAWYVFVGGEGRAVARNIFIDGNTWEDSRSVDRKPLVADFTAGAAIVADWARLGASFTHRTEEFDGQHGADEFVALNLSIQF